MNKRTWLSFPYVLWIIGFTVIPLLVIFRYAFTTGDGGLTLKNVTLSIYADQKLEYSDFGEMLFTHKGLSGPLALSACSIINKYYKKF